MKYKVYLGIAAILASGISAEARERTQSEIMDCASKVLIKNAPGQRRSPAKNQALKVLDANPTFTVVGFEGGSHAIIANDDLMPEVLGYSQTSYDFVEKNPAFEWWCANVVATYEEAKVTGQAPQRITPGVNVKSAVPQLLSDIWGQMEPYNNLCPMMHNASGREIGRAVVGCVATSATQVLRYWEYPEQPHGTHTDRETTDGDGSVMPITVNLDDYHFDYSLMRDAYAPGQYTEEEANEVAKLCYAYGVTANMIYGTDFSGTYSEDSQEALVKYWGYTGARYQELAGTNVNSWGQTIFSELSAGRPVLFAGADDWGVEGGGGHAFVFDGYDKDGLVHVNWGWFGRNNGYYDMTVLNPRIHSFKNQREMITGIQPPTAADRNKTLKLTGTVGATEFASATSQSKADGYRILDLSGATIEDGVIPSKAFYTSLYTKIILPSNVKSIKAGAFANCRYLQEVQFPAASADQDFVVEDNVIYSRDGKEVIQVMPYYTNNKFVMTDYESLLTFKDGVERILPHALDGCYGIGGVDIPQSVEEIGDHAFANMPSLRMVLVNSILPPAAGEYAFANLDPSFTRLYIPAGSYDAYWRAAEWRNFYAFDYVYDFGTVVKARNAYRMPGEPNPRFEYQMFGEYVTGEPELTCEATVDSPIGEYPIKVGMGSLQGEDIILADGVLRVVGEPAAVEAIEGDATSFDVYSIDGQVVAIGADSIANLPAGLYIINGHKVVITK